MPATAGPPAADERLVSLVLCDAGAAVLGTLPALAVRPQWWPEVGPVVDAVRERFGITVTVLRLLTTEGGGSGGRVAYLAQVRDGRIPPLTSPEPEVVAALAADDAYRLWWARPGGLDELPAWVDAALSAHDRRRTGPLRLRKSWNLSVLLSATTDAGPVWFKATPPFLADEGGVLHRVARLDPDLGPRVLAHDPGRRAVLMEEAPGEDQFGLGPADEEVVRAMVRRWVAVQDAATDDVEHLLALGALDLRAPALTAGVTDLVARPEVRLELGAEELERLEALVRGLPGRLAALAACGLPDTLVHGDLHPGNWRYDGDRLTLLDWGDVVVGHPVVDQRAFLERLADPGLRARTAAYWVEQWRARHPGADPGRAADLLAPVAELAAAVTYQRFLDHIEVTERVYHAADPVDRIRAALRTLDGSGDGR